jgi:hypothetical protein
LLFRGDGLLDTDEAAAVYDKSNPNLAEFLARNLTTGPLNGEVERPL